MPSRPTGARVLLPGVFPRLCDAATRRAGSTKARYRWIAATVALAGCAPAAPAGSEGADVHVATKDTSDTAIFGGAPDGEVGGVVALRVGQAAPFEICSAALIAPNVVLTARHCVSRMVASSVVCTDRGTSANGEHVARDQAIEDISVFVGQAPNFATTPAARASSIVHRGGSSLCNGDIALVVLDRPVWNAAPLRVRLGGSVRPYERVRAVGYGRSDITDPLGRRLRRDDIDVLAVGARLTASSTALGDREFEVGRSICQGDSGGPSIDTNTGAVVGVVSRGADCRQDYGHVYTQTSGFEALFARALKLAGSTLTNEEGLALSSTDLGGADGAGATSDIEGGCSVSGPSRAPHGAFALALACVATWFGRRRQRAR